MYTGPNPEVIWAVWCFLLVPTCLAMTEVFGILELRNFPTPSLCCLSVGLSEEKALLSS